MSKVFQKDESLASVAETMIKMVRQKIANDNTTKEELVGIVGTLLDLIANYESMAAVYRNGISFRDEHIASLEVLNERLEKGLEVADYGLGLVEALVRPFH